MFLSVVWTLILTAPIPCITDPLVSKRCNATFLQICSDEQNKLMYILDDLFSKCPFIWVNNLFNNLTNVIKHYKCQFLLAIGLSFKFENILDLKNE